MSAINSITESWNNHTFQEVETHIKDNYLPTSGGTLKGNLILQNSVIDSQGTPTPSLQFIRGTTSDDYTDWRIRNVSSTLYFGNRSASGTGGDYIDVIYFNDAGEINATRFVQSSDVRKKNIIDNVSVDIESIAQAPIFNFTWKKTTKNITQIGTSAQYWKEVLPEVVSEENDEDKSLSMDYSTTALVSVISLARKVVELENRIKKLEG